MPETVLDLIRVVCDRNPDAIAVLAPGHTCTYREISAGLGSVAAHLADLGVRAGEVVGVRAERSPGLVIAMLGVMAAGATYLPLDPSYPPKRREMMLAASNARHDLHPDRPLPQRTGVAGVASAEMSAYLMFTSGSTGQPKGVRHRHEALLNLIEWQSAASCAGPGTRTAFIAPTSFDVSLQEILATLVTGGTIVCVDDQTKRDPQLLWWLLIGQGIQRIFTPPVLLESLARHAVLDDLSACALTEIITAGEQLTVTPAVRRLFTALPDCRLINQYGPLETHVVTEYVLAGPAALWPTLPPIGRAVRGTQWQLLDIDTGLCTEAKTGELVLSGIAVADGYLNSDDDRFTVVDGVPSYRTGDLVTIMPDGALAFNGRVDDQVKISGYRVDYSEIESVVKLLHGVRQCAVAPVGHRARRMLWLFVEIDPGVIELPRIEQALSAALPPPLVPARIVSVPAIPTTPSGKVDRSALIRRTKESSLWHN